MKIPKYVEIALKRRTRAAETFTTNDFVVSEFLDKHGIEAEACDCHGGVDSIAHPRDSETRIREAIKRKV